MEVITKDEINKILAKHKLWLENKEGGVQADLSNIDLRGINLKNADLRLAILCNADLRNADLSYACLSFANLCEANLMYADLSYACLSFANLCEANLMYADLHHAMLCNTNCDGANFDFSAFPLWCGSFDMNVDERFIAQLAYHFCRLKNNSKEIIALQKQMVGLANKFHRIENGEVKKI